MYFNLKSFFVLSAILLLAPLSALAQEADTAGVTDTIPPSDVENVRATAGVGRVILQWDAATDDVGIKGYKIYSGIKSVEETNGKYNRSAIRVGKILKKTITNLKNDTTYYFAVTAIDKSGNESENYSIEVSATTPFVEQNADLPALETPPPPVITTNDVVTQNYLNLIGVIKTTRTKSGTIFYLHTYDGKRYYMMNKYKWREAVQFSSGDYKNKPVSVVGKPAYNRKGKLFGVFYSEITPVESEFGLPLTFASAESLLQTGKIYTRRINGKIALYLRSEENGKSYHLLNTPDWQKAVDFMHSKARVTVYGYYIYNRRGHLFGIRYTDIVPIFESPVW